MATGDGCNNCKHLHDGKSDPPCFCDCHKAFEQEQIERPEAGPQIVEGAPKG